MPQATATGTLGGTPIASLLVYCLDRRLTGTLVVEDHRHRKSAVALVEGAPTKVKVPEEIARLSAVLVENGVLPADQAEDTFAAAAASGSLHGRWLVEQSLIGAAEVKDALSEQVCRKVEWLCTLKPESVYGFYDKQDFLSGYGAGEGAAVDPLGLIWRVLRAHAAPAAVEATLARLGERELRLHARSRAGKFAFDARERAAVDVLRMKPQTLSALLSAGLMPPAELSRVVYALLITRHIDLGAAADPVGVDLTTTTVVPERPSSVAAPPPSSTTRHPPRSVVPRAASSVPLGEAAALRKELEALLAKIGSLNYYEMLGVERTAPTRRLSSRRSARSELKVRAAGRGRSSGRSSTGRVLPEKRPSQ